MAPAGAIAASIASVAMSNRMMLPRVLCDRPWRHIRCERGRCAALSVNSRSHDSEQNITRAGDITAGVTESAKHPIVRRGRARQGENEVGKERIGFVGLGLMGHGMAKNIVSKGFPLTVVAHRNRTPVESLVANGATEAKTPRAVAETSDIV